MMLILAVILTSGMMRLHHMERTGVCQAGGNGASYDAIASQIGSDLNSHRHRAATAEAEGSQTAPAAAPAQLVDQCGEYAGAAGADGVAEGDGAAVDVDALPVPIQFFAVGGGLGGEGFVDLDQVKVADLQSREGQHAAHSAGGRGEDVARLNRG